MSQSKRIFMEERESDIQESLLDAERLKSKLHTDKPVDLPETGLTTELSGLMATNKATRTIIAQRVVSEVTEGIRDAQQTLIYVKKGQEILKDIETNVRPFVAGKQIPKGGIKMYEAEITEKNDPDSYDYSVCEDSTLNALYNELEVLKEKIKLRETFLKALPKEMADPDTGEIIKPPLVTYGKLNVAVKLK